LLAFQHLYHLEDFADIPAEDSGRVREVAQRAREREQKLRSELKHFDIEPLELELLRPVESRLSRYVRHDDSDPGSLLQPLRRQVPPEGVLLDVKRWGYLREGELWENLPAEVVVSHRRSFSPAAEQGYALGPGR